MKPCRTVVFVSNYFNHHQRPFSDEMYRLLGDGFTFIETETMSDERKSLGWKTNETLPYVEYYEGERQQGLIDSADAVIWGSAPHELIRKRLKSKKLTFMYSERIYRGNFQLYKWPLHLLRYQLKFGRYSNLYLLGSSAYASADFAKNLTFIGKSYRWGYFPETKKYDDVESLIVSKNSKKILWCGRFLELKHPDDAIMVLKRLRDEGYDVELDIIGTGVMEIELCRLIAKNNLMNWVHLLGSMSPEEVRSNMEQASIYLFTSDHREGWGAVLNESMNSACAVVASHAIGSAPFLIEHEKNGLIYRDGDLNDLYQKVKLLLDHPQKRVELSKNAYSTIVDEWNAENAAKKFMILSTKLLNEKRKAFPFDHGVCSKADIIKDNWLK